MKIILTPLRLTLRHPFTISRGTTTHSDNLQVTVEHDGVTGCGELTPVAQATPPETAVTAERQLSALAPLLETVAPFDVQRVERLAKDAAMQPSALCGLDMALHDWIGKKLGVPVFRLFGADLSRVAATSITIGINPPDVVRERTADTMKRLAPLSLKVKLGSPDGLEHDKAILRTVKETAPAHIAIRVDANGGWKDVPTAARMIAWLAEQGVEYVEQPFAKGQEALFADLFPLRKLPIFADESCAVSADVPKLADRVDGVNLKLMKAGGIREGLRLIHAARAHGLQVMIGCRQESELAIAAGATLSAYADYLDLDSHFNLIDAPWGGLRWQDGRVLPDLETPGLGVHPTRGHAQ